jgi:hypothetical protein
MDAPMARMFVPLLCSVMCACAPQPPPALSGLWSVGQESCASGRGLRFDADAITAHRDGESRPLLEGVRYQLRPLRGEWRIRIAHALPARAGGVDPRGGDGVIDLALTRDGWLRPIARRFEDRWTGSARAPLHDLGYARALAVRRCDLPWGRLYAGAGGLRGPSR